jgi:hypothetical protein
MALSETPMLRFRGAIAKRRSRPGMTV